MLRLTLKTRSISTFAALLVGGGVISHHPATADAQNTSPQEIPVVEASALKATLDGRSQGVAFAGKGDGRGFFAITGFGKSVLSLSPWGAVQSRISLTPGGYVAKIFSLSPGRALVYTQGESTKYLVVVAEPTAKGEILRVDSGMDLNAALQGVEPVSVVTVRGPLVLVTAQNSTDVILLDTQRKAIVARADLGLRYARMAYDASSGKVYAFGQDTRPAGAAPFTAAAIIQVSDDGRLAIRKQNLSNSSMGAATDIMKVFASERAGRVVGLGLAQMIGYRTGRDVPEFTSPFHLTGVGGTAGTMSADGRYLFAASSGFSMSCGQPSAGIIEVDLQNPQTPRRCLTGLQPSNRGSYLFDFYSDPTSGLTFGYFNDVAPGQSLSNFRISLFKNGREPDLTGRANEMVSQARSGCAAAELVTSRAPSSCAVFSRATTPAPALSNK
jgi:hypothetical protein